VNQHATNDQNNYNATQDITLAYQRIQEKRFQNQNTTSSNNPILLSPIRRYFQTPQTFPQWAVKFLVENRNDIAKQISIELNGGGIHETDTQSLIKHIMNSYVYPYVAKNLHFSLPNNNRLERGDHRTALDIFIDEALWEVLNDLKKHYSIYDGKYYCLQPTHNKYKESLADVQGYGIFSRTLWILLEQEGLKLQAHENTLADLVEKIKITLDSRFKYQLEESNENSKKPNQIFNDLGYYLYKSTSVEEPKETTISPRDPETNKKIIDELIFSLSGIDYKSEHKLQLAFIPKFKGLTLLRNCLRKHMQELSKQGIFNPDLESHFFASDKLNKNKISLKSKLNGLFNNNDETNVFSSSEEVKSIYKMIQSVYELYQIGTTLYNQGQTEEQKFQGEMLIEVAVLYGERIDELGVEIEAKLKVSQFEVRKLNQYLKNLSWFISGRNYTKITSLLNH